jgi:hypothetical protein
MTDGSQLHFAAIAGEPGIQKANIATGFLNLPSIPAAWLKYSYTDIITDIVGFKYPESSVVWNL